MAKQLAELRTNMHFAVKYETGELMPIIEIVILTEKAVKNMGLDETRFQLPAREIHTLIAELQLAANGLNQFTQAGDAINSILKSMKKEEPNQ